jgi:Ca2+-transporting ATPase
MRRILPLSRINASISTDWTLNAAEVEKCRLQYGINDIAGIRTSHWSHLLFSTFKDPMIWFLICTSLLFALLKNNFEAMVLLMAIFPLIGMDAFLHWRTQSSTQSLSSRLAHSATVFRAGAKITIAAWEIVPGDLIEVCAGMVFPMDGLIIAGNNIQVEESSLTGESMPVLKKVLSILPNEGDEVSIEDGYWGFAGTKLLTGNALVRAVFTGEDSLYGQIVMSALQTTKTKTPLQQAIAKLVFSLIVVASIVCVILAVVRFYQGFGLIDAVLSAATLAVAALPDEFPVVFTFFLGVGVYRLARRKALVRRAASIENLGRITYICSDKTGTITEGRLQVAAYMPVQQADDNTVLYLLTLASRTESFDLLDLAIIEEATRKEIVIEQRVHSYPFTEDRKRETAIVEKGSKWFVATKGAPEIILSISTLSQEEKDIWLKKITELADLTYKVIGCAEMTMDKTMALQEPKQGYQFMGLVAFTDPVREGVTEAIKLCQATHIHVLMITGDHPATARAIAKEIGLGHGKPNVILAEELDLYLNTTGKQNLRQIDVIARAIPLQKYNVVKALQLRGEVVAVTGDGVNDVPALKAGDIGIAMGERGTQSARDVADIVLLDDNFGSIANAIFEGRQLFQNIKICFKYLLMIHFPFVISAAVIPLLGYPLLYYPIQVVFIELIIHPTALLVFQDLPHQNMPELKRHSGKNKFFSWPDLIEIFLIGLVTTILISVTFIYTSQYGLGTDYARGLTLAMLSFMSVAITLGLSGFKTKTVRMVISIILLLTVLFIQMPFTSTLFGFVPLYFSSWLLTVFAGFITWFLIFAWAFCIRRYNSMISPE